VSRSLREWFQQKQRKQCMINLLVLGVKRMKVGLRNLN